MTLGRWLLPTAIVATAAVVALSLGNAPQLPGGLFDFEGADKLKHCLAYGTLGVLWAGWLSPKRAAQAGLLLAALFALGALLEVLQWAFYPDRYFEFADMLANGVGAVLGILLARRIFPSL